MSYTVFARKYRPRTFDEIIGQDHIVRTLKNAIAQNRLAHAYLFVGPRGTGKTSTARILAKALNCNDGPKADFDPDEPMCREIAEGRSMNVLEFDAASNTQVDKIREIIIENVKYAPVGGRYKVYIVDEVHMLSTASFNALLKTLEEPPPHVIFVFATTDVQKVPTTILSRCQRFDLKRIPIALIRDHLLFIAKNENVGLTREAAEAIARGAEGGMRDAESMLDQLVAFCCEKIEEPDVLRVFGFTSQQTVAQLCEHLLEGDAPAALRVVHDEAEAGRDLTRLLSDLIGHLRALLVAQADVESLREELSPEAIEIVLAQTERIDRGRLLDLIERCAEAEQRMKWAPNKKMHLEIAVIRAIQTLSQATLGEVLDTLGSMREGKPLPPVAVQQQQKPVVPARPRAASAPAQAPVAVPAPAPAPRVPPIVRTPEPVVEAVIPKVTEPDPTPVAVELAASQPPRPEPAVASEASNVVSDDAGELWSAVIQRVRKERPLVAGNVESTALLEIKSDTVLVGVDSQDTLSLDLLDSPNNRKFLERVLTEAAGRPLAIKFTKREGLVATPPPREPEPQPAATKDPLQEFKNDPLIRKALELFKAEIQPV